jgi:hypothetical protein
MRGKVLAVVALISVSGAALWFSQRQPSVGAEYLVDTLRSQIFEADYRVLSLPAPGDQDQRVVEDDSRRPFFGDVHVHTSLSFDGFSVGTIATPADAYRYARGEPLQHPAGFEMKLRQPLDFYAVSDHAMFMGVAREAATVGTDYSKHNSSQSIHGLNDPERRGTDLLSTLKRMKAFSNFLPENVNAIKAGEIPVSDALDVMSAAWLETVEAARRYNDPGKFTTLVAYEFTATAADAGNLHRNVIFQNTEQLPVQPFSTLHSANPEDLWDWMDAMRERGVESLAIPHNSNGSNGHMFEMTQTDGSPIDAAYVQQRLRNEPVVEITQIKGTSETHPALSTRDEWAGFEITNERVASSLMSAPEGSYVRDALKRGLALEKLGIGNPYDFAVIGSSDTHNAASGVSEDDYVSKLGLISANGQLRGSIPFDWWDGLAIKLATQDLVKTVEGKTYIGGSLPTFGASGLAGVWAEANTREHIYQAFRRGETFATSGPRISLRFFAGFDFDDDMLKTNGVVAEAYRRGVTMGGHLTLQGMQQPTFILWAMADANSAPLQRLQIIKGWIDNAGDVHEAVFDVACAGGADLDPVSHRCPDNGADVDLSNCELSASSGAAQLRTVWRDPNYSKGQRAFYYARVLENPSCRWSTWDAIRAGIKPRSDFPATLQERAWSSAIQVY